MANFWDSIGQNKQSTTPQQQNNSGENGVGGFNLQELMKFAGQMQGKNTEQMVYEYMKQNGIGNDKLTEVMGMAKQVMPMLKNLGIFK